MSQASQVLDPTSSREMSENQDTSEARAKRSLSRATVEEEMLLNSLEERGRQSIQLQEKLLEMIKPAGRPSERTSYGDWAKTVMEDLEPNLWRQFQQEHSQLLYKYLDLNDKVRSQPLPPHQQQWLPGQHQPSGSQYVQWQPPPVPHNWPGKSLQSTLVWNATTATGTSAQMQHEPNLTTLQPRGNPQDHGSSTAGPTASTPRSGKHVSNMSGILTDSFVEELQRCDSGK